MAKKVTNVRFEEEHLEALDKIADSHPEMSRASVVRMAVRRFLEDIGEGDLTVDKVQQELFGVDSS